MLWYRHKIYQHIPLFSLLTIMRNKIMAIKIGKINQIILLTFILVTQNFKD